MATAVRLYLDHPLAPGEAVALNADQSHYLFAVMRRGQGDTVLVFDGRHGEWEAEVTAASRRGGRLVCGRQTRPQSDPPDLWLLFAPIKKARTDFIVEKAAELGAARILPVRTDHGQSDRIRRDRLQAHAVEAVEQCGGTAVPEVAELAPLAALLDAWPAERRLGYGDEALAGAAAPGTAPFAEADRGAPWALLVGPEGGFSAAERARLEAMAQSLPLRLGPRVLRADTAAVALLTLWQAALGDW